VKYILISCIKLVFLFIIIWCKETQYWKIKMDLEDVGWGRGLDWSGCG